MSWIALTDLSRPTFNIRGIGVPPDAPGARPQPGPYEILPTGTLVFELGTRPELSEPWQVVTFDRRKEWRREIAFEIHESGRLRLAFRQGSARSVAEIKIALPSRESPMRVSYSWDAPNRSARLTVELLETGQLFQARSANPVPLPVADAKALIRSGRAARIDPAVRMIAVSDAVEPVGPNGGIAPGTMVETVEGPVPVERLRRGDAVITATSGAQPIRWISKRTVPALGAFRPVRIRAPFFGLGHDVITAPDHRVRLDLAEAEYMLDSNEVFIPAGYLVNGRTAHRETGNRLVTYYQVLLDTHDCLLHGGLWAESLFVGALARYPRLLESSALSELAPSALPRHRPMTRKPLTSFESRSIAAVLQRAV